ncbi:MAG TPA: DUF4832 domain-containing protein [Polyangiaceae bacterium]|nr:DUF4832 domain-containing protein [Polyangiaceae bacterium]
MLNPERGFYATTNLVDAQDLSGLRTSGVTLVHSYVRLDDFRMADIPASLLTQATAGFAQARKAGVKVVLRFAYNFGPYPDSEPDAPKAWVLKHIGQLKPLLEANADVIAVVQAGFIGAWGEWHTSTNGLTDPATRQEILETLVDAVPASRSVQLRYPAYKRAIYGDALGVATAFDGSRAARIGHHNDCFVSSDTDVGTYPADQIDFYRDYVGADTAFVPMGGETCAVDAPRSECLSAIAEMTKMHFSYINREFQADVLTSWQPCMNEIEKRLGYRLLLKTAELPEMVKPGGSFTFTAQLENQGFAAPFNARPVYLVLRGGNVNQHVLLGKADPRRWLTGGGIQARVRLPSSLPAGTYTLGLWLPDAAESLQARAEYALELANDGVWSDTSGENLLGSIEVTQDARGSAVADAASLAILAE